MRIVVDINHPGHVHFFKNFIAQMEKHSHEILITSTEKDQTFLLLKEYGLKFVSFGSLGKRHLQKILNLSVYFTFCFLASRA